MALYRFEENDPQFGHLWRVSQPRVQELWVESQNEQNLELLKRLPDDGLCIVGTRSPLRRSEAFTDSVVYEVRNSRLIILSGMARGIDTAAHEAAVDYHLPTVAVLGFGHHHFYPSESRSLREKILNNGGLIISEFPPEIPPRPHQFVKRNRCLAAWSKAVCVMEAPIRSGSLITADYAMEHHATIFATPSFPGDSCFAGNQLLLDDYAANPLWGAHSLGAVWIELATLTPPKAR